MNYHFALVSSVLCVVGVLFLGLGWRGAMTRRRPCMCMVAPARWTRSVAQVLRTGAITAAVVSFASLVSSPASGVQVQFANSGGSVSIDGNNDLGVVNSIVASPAGSVTLSCPLVALPNPTPPYSATWTCAGGSVSLEATGAATSVTGTFTSGKLTLEVVGGGHDNPPTYLYRFTGSFAGTSSVNGHAEAITGATTQVLAPLASSLGTGTIEAGSTFVNTVFGPTYVADTANDRIVRVDDLAGTNWTTLGSEGAEPQQFSHPQALAVDQAGMIYVADAGNDRIVRVDNITGANWTAYGTTGSGVGQFHQPSSVTLDSSGRIYVADAGNSRIVRIDDLAGTNWTTLGTPGSGTGQFDQPLGVVVDRGGAIYVADKSNNRIVRVDDSTGRNWVSLGTLGAGTGQFDAPSGVAVDAAGKIYVADTVNNRIVRVDDIAGSNFTAFGTLGTGVGQFVNPAGVTVDGSGTIYVADARNGRVARFDDLQGAAWTTYGSFGTGEGQFRLPIGIAVAASKPAVPLIGDCDNDGRVTVEEIVTLVNIAQGDAPSSACALGIPSNGLVDVAVIVQAVNNALAT